MEVSRLFIDPTELPQNIYGLAQTVFLAVVYGAVLFQASKQISDGSELLLLIPWLAGIVGSVVLPILGAVPDGAIVYFSGMGPNAKEQLSVGVGALAGSTITLLTVPWFLTILGGRVDVKPNGTLNYKKPSDADNGWKKSTRCSLTGSAVASGAYVAAQGRVMMLLSLCYLVIQLPSLTADEHQSKPSELESLSALIGMTLCFTGFLWYLYREFNRVDDSLELQAKANEIRIQAISGKTMTLKGVMYELLDLQKQSVGGEALLPYQPSAAGRTAMKSLLRPFFHHLDVDKSGQLDKKEAKVLFSALNQQPTDRDIDFHFSLADSDNSGFIEFDEFVDMMIKYVVAKESELEESPQQMEKLENAGSDSEDGDSEEIPEDLAHLSPHEQQKRVLMRSMMMMLFGTAVVLIFSDPMVDVLSEVGNRTGIPPFYVSFVLAPLASNASEIVAAFSYAKKKTRKSANIAFATLCGAASMNNTFVLGIFLAIVYFKDLVWVYSAETCCILFVQLLVGVLSQKEVQYLFIGLLALALYPASLVLVALLKS